jgi:hypothetical protein
LISRVISRHFLDFFKKIATYLFHFAVGSKKYRRILRFFSFHSSFVAKLVKFVLWMFSTLAISQNSFKNIIWNAIHPECAPRRAQNF